MQDDSSFSRMLVPSAEARAAACDLDRFQVKARGFVLALYQGIPAADFDNARKHIEKIAAAIGEPVNMAVYPDSGDYVDQIFFPENMPPDFTGPKGWQLGVLCDDCSELSNDEFIQKVLDHRAPKLIGPEYIFVLGDSVSHALGLQRVNALRQNKELEGLRGEWEVWPDVGMAMGAPEVGLS